MESHLPPEIWWVILNILPSPDILRVACVCRQWRHLATKICRNRCQFLPPRLLIELTHECSLAHHAQHITPTNPPDLAISPPDLAPSSPDPAHISFNPAHRPPTPKPWPSDTTETSPKPNETPKPDAQLTTNDNNTTNTNTTLTTAQSTASYTTLSTHVTPNTIETTQNTSITSITTPNVTQSTRNTAQVTLNTPQTPNTTQATPSTTHSTPNTTQKTSSPTYTTLNAPETTPTTTQITPNATHATHNAPQLTHSPNAPTDELQDDLSPTPPSNNDEMEVEVNDEDDGGVDWLNVTRMVVRTRLTTRPDDCSVTRQLADVTLLVSTGSFMVVVEHVERGGRLMVFTEEGEECHTSFTGTINKVCVMESGGNPPMLAVCVDKELQFLLVQRNPKPLTPLNVTPYLSVDSRMSCEGHTLVMSQLVDEYHLAIYQAQLVSSTGVALTLQGRITTSSSPLIWDLWNGFVTVLVSGGYVNCYTLCGTLVGESPLYKDLRYPNPTLLSRGLIFASTITSRTLLSYWHMDRDRDYWLVGESVLTGWVQRGAEAVGNTATTNTQTMDVDEQPGYSCILTLAKVRVGSAHMQEVTAIHYRRGIVFCGTRLGDMLIYKILAEELEPSKNKSEAKGNKRSKDRSTSSPTNKTRDRSSPSSSEGIKFGRMECCSPLLHLSLGQSPVYRLSSYFTSQGIVVAVGDRDRGCQMVNIPYTYLIT